MTTPAEKIRNLAGVASPGPWRTTGAGDHGWTVSMPSSGLAIETEDSEQGAVDADYIAAMHPGVGSALADWLDSAAQLAANYPDLARDHDRQGCDDYACDVMGRALAVARAINGGQP